MLGQFNSPVSLPSDPNAPVPVSGPLSNVDPSIEEATIVCVLVQEGPNPLWVEGRGTWKKPLSGAADWTGIVSRQGRVIGGSGGTGTLQPGKDVRGIAMAVAVKEQPQPTSNGQSPEEQTEETQGAHFVPPSIDSQTWCVHIQVV